MIKDNTMYLVKNRSSGRVVYTIPDMNIKRNFAPGETQKIAFKELEKLSFQPGGKELMANFLQIRAEEVLTQLSVSTQPEYFMSEQQIIDLIKTGSYEAFLDCLDYAPVGVIDLLKQFAVELPLADYKKRKAMKEKLGYDVDKILANKEAEKEEEKNPGGFVETKSTEKTVAQARPTGRRTSVTYKNENEDTTSAKE